MRTLGRVSFINCDPVFHSLGERWGILPAPPAWLTGHLLRRDCITAPIPTADYAKHAEDLHLIPDLGIVSNGTVGSVLVLGNRPVESMRDIALPSDSSTSISLLRWILKERNLEPKLVEMGPDLTAMLGSCDGALLIGNRALAASMSNPTMVQLDLGAEWKSMTGLPMVFGVFAARRDSQLNAIRDAHKEMSEQYSLFLHDEDTKSSVIEIAAETIGFDKERIGYYFKEEVSNVLDEQSLDGLNRFLIDVCGLEGGARWISLS